MNSEPLWMPLEEGARILSVRALPNLGIVTITIEDGRTGVSVVLRPPEVERLLDYLTRQTF